MEAPPGPSESRLEQFRNLRPADMVLTAAHGIDLGHTWQFASKAALERCLKYIRRNYDNHEAFNVEDNEFMLCVLERHPDADNLTRDGTAVGVVVHRNPETYNSRPFFVVYDDDTHEKFALENVVRSDIPGATRRLVMRMCRNAIRVIVAEHRAHLPNVCVRCGIRGLAYHDTGDVAEAVDTARTIVALHVDHCGTPFCDLVSSWFLDQGYTMTYAGLSSMILRSTTACNQWSSPHRETWENYHNQRARFQMLCARCNNELGSTLH